MLSLDRALHRATCALGPLRHAHRLAAPSFIAATFVLDSFPSSTFLFYFLLWPWRVLPPVHAMVEVKFHKLHQANSSSPDMAKKAHGFPIPVSAIKLPPSSSSPTFILQIYLQHKRILLWRYTVATIFNRRMLWPVGDQLMVSV